MTKINSKRQRHEAAPQKGLKTLAVTFHVFINRLNRYSVAEHCTAVLGMIVFQLSKCTTFLQLLTSSEKKGYTLASKGFTFNN